MARINYGIDAPGVIRNFFIIALLLLLVGFFLPVVQVGNIRILFSPMAFTMAVVFLLQGLLMLLYAKHGKFNHRDRILALYNWKGDETVLDVGTGRGLLMIGAAKKLTTGKSIGIDIWNTADLSSNTPENAQQNARLEGVADKVVVESRNIVSSGFPDSYFDVIVSNLCLHNIYNKQQRRAACTEIYRILKPGGVAIISDFKLTREYRRVFNGLGMQTEKVPPDFLTTFPPLSIIKAVKLH